MGGTPPEEIAKQHQEALQLVENGMPCTPLTIGDEISLEWKQQPTEQLLLNQRQQEALLSANSDSEDGEEKKDNEATKTCPCVSSRGRVDITKLVALVREGYNDNKLVIDGNKNIVKRTKQSTTATTTTPTAIQSVHTTNLWDETNAATNNVAIVRPSHDAWGIKKICLVFCDDFLQDTYELPWWHSRNDIREAIQPILNVLEIQPTQIVRLLLAALPPEVTIPTHHDSGEWVKQTHRVHVPVLMRDPSKVLFRCGLTQDNMIRVDVTPGHVFELNNQGKHAVSNCGNDHRVHLILDYVDTDFELKNPPNRPRRRLQLSPGEVLLQTRRSIDRSLEMGKRPTPSFFILGAQKAGTTSLYEYIMQHPLVARPKRRETHNLDWRWNDTLTTVEEQREYCQSFYHTKELQQHPSILTGDSTPSYLLDSLRVIPRLKRVFSWKCKFLVMLRNPVQRAYSHYQMVTSLDGTPEQIKTRGTEWHSKTFQQVVQQDLTRLNACGVIPYWNLETATVDQQLFDAFVGSDEEMQAWNRYLEDIPMNTGSHSLVSRGMYDLQLRPWFAAFLRNDFLVLNLDNLKSGDGVQNTMKQVWKHLELPNMTVADDSAKNARSYDKMDQDIALYLEKFFEPHNRRLVQLLGSEWDGVWR